MDDLTFETLLAKALGVTLGIMATIAFGGAMLAAWGVAHHAMRIASGCPYDDDAPDRPWRRESCAAVIIQTISLAFLWMGLVIFTGGESLGLDRHLSSGLAITWFISGGVFNFWAMIHIAKSWKRGPLHEALDRPGWLSLQLFICLFSGVLLILLGLMCFNIEKDSFAM
ncbi:MAG: hypothetical protein N3A38_01570 [Planctomycetota bacterium]|nr:hypothetical protein [Planctomycetota bacterium]